MGDSILCYYYKLYQVTFLLLQSHTGIKGHWHCMALFMGLLLSGCTSSLPVIVLSVSVMSFL